MIVLKKTYQFGVLFRFSSVIILLIRKFEYGNMFIILIEHFFASPENLTKCQLRYFLHSENDMCLLCQFQKFDKNIIFTKKVDLIF